MAVISVARPRTTAEALGPIVADLFESIDRSKKLRGERLQFESVFKSLDSLSEEATPEEKMAAARGALQQVRTQSRDQNEGFLARIIKGLDPRVPSFGEGVSLMEKFVADQQLGIAFSDTRLLDSQIELNKQRAAELERRPETGGADKPLTSQQIGRRAFDMKAFIDRAKSERRFGPNVSQEALLKSWEDYKAAPGTDWENLSTGQQQDTWLAYKALIAKTQQETGELEFDPTSSEVQAATPGIEQAKSTGSRQPLGPELSKTLPANITFSELAELAQGLDASSQNELLEIQRRFFDAQKSGDEQAIAAAGADYQEAITILRGRR